MMQDTQYLLDESGNVRIFKDMGDGTSSIQIIGPDHPEYEIFVMIAQGETQ
jgi:hypothetical protein